MSKNWYLIQFKPNAYRLAERNLNRQGFETFLPVQEVIKRKASRFVHYLRPLFPGYMFVSVYSELKPWRKINSTIGISRLVTFNGQPKPLPPLLIARLMSRCNLSGKLLPPEHLHKGERVELLTGPFANFVATVEMIEEEKRIWIVMDFMGQTTRIQVSSEHLQPITL